MNLTDKQLQAMALQCLNMAKRDIEYKRWRGIVLAVYHEGDQPSPLHRMRAVERQIPQLIGDEWLNDSAAKKATFDVIRAVVLHLNPEATVFCTLSNSFKPTSKLLAQGHDEVMKVVSAGHDRHHLAVAEGLMTVEDALASLAQSPQRFCQVLQPIRGKLLIGPPQIHCFDQQDFSGLLKMYGVPGAKTLDQLLSEAECQDILQEIIQ